MVAVIDPGDLDFPRQLVARDLIAVAQGVARALDYQGGRAQGAQMLDTGVLRAAGGMEGVAQTDQAGRADLVSHHARDAPAHRLAANYQPRGAAQLLDN